MEPGQFIYYICWGICVPAELNYGAVCEIPDVKESFEIKDSPYKIVLETQ